MRTSQKPAQIAPQRNIAPARGSGRSLTEGDRQIFKIWVPKIITKTITLRVTKLQKDADKPVMTMATTNCRIVRCSGLWSSLSSRRGFISFKKVLTDFLLKCGSLLVYVTASKQPSVPKNMHIA